MNKKIRIEDLKLVYDRDNNKFVKAFVTIDGEKQILTDNIEIRKIMDQFKSERGIKEIHERRNEYSLAYASNTKVVASFESKYQDVKEVETEPTIAPLPIVLNKNNPYDGKEVKEYSDFHDLKCGIKSGLVAVSAAAVASLAIVIGSGAFNSIAKDAKVIEMVQDKEQAKVNPESWKQYVDEYAESKQKTFLTGVMKQITDNIVDVTVNEKEYKLALSPEEMIALNYYYNTFEMTNEDMLSIYGLYNLDAGDNGDLNNNVHNALDKIRLSLVKAEKVEDVIMPEFTDEVTKELFTKYAKLYVDFNNAKSKSSIKSEFENMFRADFIENGSVDLNEHPSATVILQLFPSAFNLSNSPLNAKLNKILVGQETNIDVDGVKDTVEQNGLVDESCSVIDRRLEKFDEDRQLMLSNHRIDSRLNRELLLDVNEDLKDDKDQQYYDDRHVESDYSKLTKDTYDVKTVMIPLMNEELKMNFDLGDVVVSFEEVTDEIMKEMISELQQQQLNNNKPWNLKTNPSGGKKGDVLKGETVKGVTVTEQQLLNSGVSQQEINDAKQEYLDKNPDVVDGTDNEAIKEKEEEIKEDLSALCVEAWEVGQKETINGGPNATLNTKYANHKEEVVRNAYYDGRNNGIKVWNEKQAAKDNPVVETPSDEPEHKDNPNQKEDNNNNDNPVVEEVETEKPAEQEQTPPQQNDTPSESELDPSLGEPGGSHDENPNQNNNPGEDTPIVENVDTSNTTYNIDTTDVIEDTITTDPTGVEDMSQYGEVQEASITSYSVEQIINSYIEELEDPNSEINMVVETPYELIK